MCGITGWVAFDQNVTRVRPLIDAMTETMSCRGPDASGVWSDQNASLGHRRLAVIDIPGGAQPMSVSTPNGEVAMVYSGEAYNFKELRDELIRKGERFETSSDTEVVLRGYLHWGEVLADRLNGMYAFAIWDSRLRKLVMIRDRMGIKPFYFYPTPDGVLFGSEPKAILANPLAKRIVDIDGLREMMVQVKTPKHAIWKGMREVEPGSIVTVDEHGLHERTYWRLESVLHTDDQDKTVARVRELLDDIVRRQLIADVPECVLLSGGLDSSAITALSARELIEPVRTFAVDFVDQAENFKPNDMRPTMDTPYVHDRRDGPTDAPRDSHGQRGPEHAGANARRQVETTHQRSAWYHRRCQRAATLPLRPSWPTTAVINRYDQATANGDRACWPTRRGLGIGADTRDGIVDLSQRNWPM